MKSVYLFRHGETDWNKAGRLQGKTNIGLNELGRMQAERLRQFFAASPVDVFLSSHLDRAHETAKIARGELTVPIILEPRICETNLGLAERLTVAEVIEQFGENAWASWHGSHKENGTFRFPEGESKHEHLHRVISGLEDFLKQTPHERVGVASHGGAMRRLIHHLRPELADSVMVGNCALFELSFEAENGRWSIDLDARCR